jgi:hypothetical protein
MAKKPGQLSGFSKGLSVAAKIAEVTNLSFMLKIKEEKLYKDEGFESWDAYCRATYGVTRQSIDERLKTISEIGPEIMKIMHSVKMRPRQLALLLSEDQKAAVRGGVLKVGDREIEIRTENAADIQAAVDALIKEHTKGVKASAKIQDAQDRLITDLTAIKQKYERQYPAKDHDWVGANRPVHSHLWEAFLGDFQDFVLNDRAMNNEQALAYIREMHDRIIGNLQDLNEIFRKQTGGLSFIRKERGSK